MAVPEITVLITGYKIETYIERAIRSVLVQEGVDLEIVIIDDCSPDGTWDVIQGIRDPRITAMRTPINSGPSATRNLGLAAAKGDWVAILDGDDIYLPGRLARMLKLAKAARADIAVDNKQIMEEVSGAMRPMFERTDLEAAATLTTDKFIAGNAHFGSHGYGYFKPMLRRAFVEEHGIRYAEDIRIGEDYLFLLTCFMAGAKCVVDPEMGYGYTIRKGSISHRLNAEDVAIMLREDEKFFAARPMSDAVRKAHAVRTASLQEMLAYVQMVAAVKSRQPGDFMKAWASRPIAIRQFSAPLAKRVNRLLKSA